MRGTYWSCPHELRDKVEVSSMMENLGYKGGGYFGTKEEATLNIEPFWLHTEQLCKTHSSRDGDGGGGGSRASHMKVYFATTRDTTRSGGRDKVVAEAGFVARKRPSGKKQKLHESL